MSYARETPEERAYVADVAAQLEQLGFAVFFDKNAHADFIGNGDTLRRQLISIFQQTPLVVLFLSSAYEESDYCKIEMEAALVSFMAHTLPGKTVLEVGAGAGYISQHLVGLAKELVCIDCCPAMIAAHKRLLQGRTGVGVRYEQGFAQDVLGSIEGDIAVCCRVLVHNVGESEFAGLVGALCRSAKMVFVFEDVSINRKTSPATHLRDQSEIVAAFAKMGFERAREAKYRHFDDDYCFFEFRRR